MAFVIMDFIKAMQDNEGLGTEAVSFCMSVCVSVCVWTPIQTTPCVTNKFIKRSQCLVQNIIINLTEVGLWYHSIGSVRYNTVQGSTVSLNDNNKSRSAWHA